jgi:F-type H+/Na+-transporting ATPase subunit alpha
MIPIRCGQRELIIGHRQTGKTAIAIETIINQKGKDLICIYFAIGQKKAAAARTVGMIELHRAMAHTIVMVASADESIALQYIAPFAGCAIGGEFMKTGRDAMVIYLNSPCPIAESPCSYINYVDVKLIHATFSTGTLACWNILPL